jgi:hypothetical protein
VNGSSRAVTKAATFCIRKVQTQLLDPVEQFLSGAPCDMMMPLCKAASKVGPCILLRDIVPELRLFDVSHHQGVGLSMGHAGQLRVPLQVSRCTPVLTMWTAQQVGVGKQAAQRQAC